MRRDKNSMYRQIFRNIDEIIWWDIDESPHRDIEGHKSHISEMAARTKEITLSAVEVTE